MERLKQLNPILPDLMVSQLAVLVLGELIILALLPYKFALALGWILGTIFVIFSLIHMAKVWERAVYYEEKGAMVRTVGGYFVRLLVLFVLFVAVYFAGGLHGVFSMILSIFTMKVSAYLQPFTHKFMTIMQRKGR